MVLQKYSGRIQNKLEILRIGVEMNIEYYRSAEYRISNPEEFIQIFPVKSELLRASSVGFEKLYSGGTMRSRELSSQWFFMRQNGNGVMKKQAVL